MCAERRNISAVQLLRVSVHERINAAAEDFLLQVEKGGETAQVPSLRAMLTERLTVAAEEILAVIEETMAEYEDRVEQSELEICRQRRLLDAVMNPEVRLHRADILQLVVSKEEVPSEQQQWSSSVDQEDLETPHIKEELEELWTNKKGEQLQQLEEADMKFTLTPFAVKSEEDEDKPQWTQLHQSQTEENRADCGGPEPARNSGPDGHLQPGPEDQNEDSCDTEELEICRQRRLLNAMMKLEVRLHRADILQLVVSKEEVPSEQQQWSSLVDQEDPEPPHIKEELEELWTNQKGEQLQQLEEADMKFTLTPVAVKSEEEEEKAQLTQPQQIQTEENRTDCGGPEPARNSGPEGHLQPGPEDKTEDSSETEVSEDDWILTSEPGPGLNIRNNKQPLSDMRCKTDKKPFSCSECTKRYRYKSALTQHIRVHSGEKPFSCTHCAKRYRYKGALTEHIRVHTGEKPFSCSHCARKFSQSGHLTVHMRSHTGEKPFSCTQCGMKFSRNGTLTRHMLSHTGEKPFSCTHCGQTFGRSGNLTVHMRLHKGDKPFSCTQCGQRFTERDSLNVHIRSHTGEKPFSCSQCGKRFTEKAHLKVHMRIHTGEKPFSCSECGQRFRIKNCLTNHMRRHTGEKPFSCTQCGRTFGQSKALTRHMKSLHPCSDLA
ncbi:zinc finger protein 37 [Pleuronectes platessa]|uniref:zinc finger protein 37 n=1 Tax=Pleuronectes platessa TaxID=8262 RepID=UPI00232A4DE3|nr:zinc finger protein 37 [Pleuronectes platessa]